MSKLNFWVIAGVISLCYGVEEFQRTDYTNDTEIANDQITNKETDINTDPYNIPENNELWRKNDRIILNYRKIFDNIASTVNDAPNQQRRAFSIIISGVLIYLASNGDNSMTVDLSEPADVISTDLRTVIVQMEGVLGPMVEETKMLCRPKTPQATCDRRVNSFISEQEQQCRGFSEHVRFWRTSLELFNDNDYLRFLCDAIKTSKSVEKDSEATAYLNQVIEGKKHSAALRKLKLWFESYSSGNYPCNLPPVKCPLRVTLKPQQQVTYVIKEKYKRRHKHHSSSEEHEHRCHCKRDSSEEKYQNYHHHDEDKEQ